MNAKRGRPEVEEPRKKYVSVRVSDAEKQSVEAKARKMGKLSISNYIRKKLGLPVIKKKD